MTSWPEIKGIVYLAHFSFRLTPKSYAFYTDSQCKSVGSSQNCCKRLCSWLRLPTCRVLSCLPACLQHTLASPRRCKALGSPGDPDAGPPGLILGHTTHNKHACVSPSPRSSNAVGTVQGRLDAGVLEARVLAGVVNASIRDVIFPTIVLFLPMAQTLTGTTLLTAGTQVPISQIIFFGLVYTVGILVNVAATSAAAQIYISSKRAVQEVRISVERVSDKKTPKYMTRLTRSLWPIRLEFGYNFVDEMTPLVVQEYCQRQLVTLALVSKL